MFDGSSIDGFELKEDGTSSTDTNDNAGYFSLDPEDTGLDCLHARISERSPGLLNRKPDNKKYSWRSYP